MIKFVEHKNINKKKWDEAINSSSYPSVFAYSWYLDVVCKGWSALIVGDYETVFPIASKTKYKIHYIFQPFFTRYFGVFSKQKITSKMVSEFLEAIPEKFRYVEFCLEENQSVSGKGLETKEKKFQLLDLGGKYEQLQKGYSDNAKRNIKKAVKAGLKIRPDIAPAKIVQLFKATKGNELEVFDAEDYKILVELMDTCNDLKKGQSIAIYDGNVLCAAGFFMFSNNRFTFLKSGVTEDGKAKGAMHLLFDYFIQNNAGKRYELDFGGSSVESVARFYKNFGAKDCVYLQVKRNNLPKLVKWVKSLKK